MGTGIHWTIDGWISGHGGHVKKPRRKSQFRIVGETGHVSAHSFDFAKQHSRESPFTRLTTKPNRDMAAKSVQVGCLEKFGTGPPTPMPAVIYLNLPKSSWYECFETARHTHEEINIQSWFAGCLHGYRREHRPLRSVNPVAPGGLKKRRSPLDCAVFDKMHAAHFVCAKKIYHSEQTGGNRWANEVTLGMNQNETTSRRQVLVLVSIYQGSILGLPSF